MGLNLFHIMAGARMANKVYEAWQRNSTAANNEERPLAGDGSEVHNADVNEILQSMAADPGFDLDVLQKEQDTCAIHSQYHVLKEYGYDGSVDDLIKEAAEKGWYVPGDTAPGGTAPDDLGNLLESNGVPCKNVTGATVFDLMDEIAQGKSVIVSVDSGELANGEDRLTDILENSNGTGADHAITIRDIHLDMDDFGNSKVICTDSGTGHIAKELSIGQFMDSWQDGRFRMVVPLEPPPQEMELDRLSGFNYETGHFAGLDSISWQDYYDNYTNGLDDELAGSALGEDSDGSGIFEDSQENSLLGGDADGSGIFEDSLESSLLGEDGADSFGYDDAQDCFGSNDLDDQLGGEASNPFYEEYSADTLVNDSCDAVFSEEASCNNFFTSEDAGCEFAENLQTGALVSVDAEDFGEVAADFAEEGIEFADY